MHPQQLCGTELQFVSLLRGCPVPLELPQHKASSWQRVRGAVTPPVLVLESSTCLALFFVLN